MESRLKIEARGSSLAREVIGGLTTFLDMAYIAVANPAILLVDWHETTAWRLRFP